MFKLILLLAVSVAVTAAPKPSGLLAIPAVVPTEPIFPGHTSTVLKPTLEHEIKTAVISEPGAIEVREPFVAKLGDVVHSVPTAVSHTSSTIVHRKSVATPVVVSAFKTYTAPVIKTYTFPVISPVLRTYATPAVTYGSTPLLRTLPVTPFVSVLKAPIIF